MTLVATLIALILERFIGLRAELRRFDWFLQFSRTVRSKLPQNPFWQKEIAILITFSPILFAVATALHLLDESHALLAFFAGVAILLFSLGPKNLEDQIKGYLNAEESGNLKNMHWYAEDIVDQNLPNSHEHLDQAVADWALIRANHRLFGALFWFFILGPLGALFYRLASELHRHCLKNQEEPCPYSETTERLFLILNWAPTRLTAFSYAITGNFVAAYDQWRRQLDKQDPNPNTALLLQVARGALKSEEQDNKVRASFALIKRTLILWLTTLALLTLVGWVT